MAMFQEKVIVSNVLDNSLSFEADFWIDTGALYSFIPEDRLASINFEPITTKSLIYADNRSDRRLFGTCLFELPGIEEKISCYVIAAPKDSLFLLGATALEAFGLAADPINKKLISVNAIIANIIPGNPIF